MALARTLVEQLTCPICRDIYTNPRVLKCHHSICADCLEGLKGASLVRWKVECPVCREECPTNAIATDFRTVTLLEAHAEATKAGQIPDSESDVEDYDKCDTSGSRLCDLCKKDPVRQNCKDCQKLFCHQCSKNHKTLPACHNHSLSGLGEIVNQEKATLVDQRERLLKEDKKTDEKKKEIVNFKSALDSLEERTIAELNQWYDSIVAQAGHQKDVLIRKTQRLLEAERAGAAEKERVVDEKQTKVKESLRMIQEIQTEEDPANVLGRIESLQEDLNQRALEDSPYDIRHITIPSLPQVRVSLGKRWDETKAIHLNVKKSGASGHSPSMVTFPSDLASAQYSKKKEVTVTTGTKQILVHKGYLWCLYDDRIDIYDAQGCLYKTIREPIRIPNGIVCLPSNSNVVVACMGTGLVEFTAKGKLVAVLAEGNACDVSADHKHVYSLDYTDGRPTLRAFRKKRFQWKKVLDRPLENDKCNTFDTLLANQTSIFVSATAENVLVEYTRDGELVSRLSGPRATRLCSGDTWGNILLTNHESNEVWLFKNDQTWHRVDVEGLTKPYGATMDEDGGLWVSNTSSIVSRYTSQGNTLREG